MPLQCLVGGIAVASLPCILGDVVVLVGGMQMHGTIVDD
jgi:hypothetical protein